MTKEMPKNYGFLKFIVIFMGILIVLGLTVVVWKVVDLARHRTARQAQPLAKMPNESFKAALVLKPGEAILQISAVANGVWIRVGSNGKTDRVILVDRTGKITGMIKVKRINEDAVSAN